MSSKLKEFITQLRACKTTEEEKQLISKEKAAILQSFQKNQSQLKPRNLVKLLFINLQGGDTDFGQMESLNLACRTSFIEKKIGYLTMSIFLHEKSEMLMMATNRIALDLDHKNPFIRAIALSTFSSIADVDMARQISPKIIKLISEEGEGFKDMQSAYYEEGYKSNLVKKKALLAAFRVIQKCPELVEEYAEVFDKCLRENDHGVLLSCLPLFENLVKLSDKKVFGKFQKLSLMFIDKGRSLISHVDPDYSVNGINDPILLIGMIKSLRIILVTAEANGYELLREFLVEVQKFVIFTISIIKPNKKTANAVLYEIARLALLLHTSDELTSCGFLILNQLLDTKDTNPNFKFVSLNLLKNFENFNQSAFEMLSTHCELILNILEDPKEDASLKNLALTVLPLITATSNIKSVLENLKGLLVLQTSEIETRKVSAEQLSFCRQLVTSAFYILEHKFSGSLQNRVGESIKLLLIVHEEVDEKYLSSLIQLINNNEDLQKWVVTTVWSYLKANWQQLSFFKLATYTLGEYSDLLADGSLGLTAKQILDFYVSTTDKIKDPECKLHLLNSVAKLIIKSDNLAPRDEARYLSIIQGYKTDINPDVQNRATEYDALITCKELTKSQLKEIFGSCPAFINKENKSNVKIRKGQIKERTISVNHQSSTRKDDKASLNEIYSFSQTILKDSEIEAKLEYNYNNLSLEGILRVSNITKTELYNMSAQIVCLDGSSQFSSRKVERLDPRSNQVWDYRIVLKSADQNSCRLKYTIRFYYSPKDTSEDFRINKESVYDLHFTGKSLQAVAKNDDLMELDLLDGPNIPLKTIESNTKDRVSPNFDFDLI